MPVQRDKEGRQSHPPRKGPLSRPATCPWGSQFHASPVVGHRLGPGRSRGDIAGRRQSRGGGQGSVTLLARVHPPTRLGGADPLGKGLSRRVRAGSCRREPRGKTCRSPAGLRAGTPGQGAGWERCRPLISAGGRAGEIPFKTNKAQTPSHVKYGSPRPAPPGCAPLLRATRPRADPDPGGGGVGCRSRAPSAPALHVALARRGPPRAPGERKARMVTSQDGSDLHGQQEVSEKSDLYLLWKTSCGQTSCKHPEILAAVSGFPAKRCSHSHWSRWEPLPPGEGNRAKAPRERAGQPRRM